MKSLLRLSFVILILFLVFQLAKNIHIGGAQPISTPKNKAVPLKGEWIVNKFKTTSDQRADKDFLSDWMGKRVYFSEEIAVLGEETCAKPQYKVKTLGTGEYLLYNYSISMTELGIQNQEVDIISVTSDDKHFYDFLRLDENNVIVYVDKTFLFLEKVSENIRSSDVAEKVKNNKADINSAQAEEDKLLRSGVLIGLRSQEVPIQDAYNLSRPSYRTLWIAARNRKLYPIRETGGLLVPRMNGFWKVEVRKQYKNNFLKESIFAYPLDSTSRSSLYDREEEKVETNVLKNILFIGNDYISIEYGEGKELNSIQYDRLQIVPIDKPESSSKVKISDIEGENGKNALINSAKAFMVSNQNLKIENLEKEPREDNFAMTRRNGHWIMKGRLDYLNPVDGNRYEDFNINIMPSKKLVTYDELAVSWNAIKEKVPEALDAYTSPNKDMAIIVTRNLIYVYEIDNSILSGKPIDKIKIHEGESVIMAEWATGEYVDRWEKVLGQDSWIVE